MNKFLMVFVFTLLNICSIAQAQEKSLDTVDVYIVPMEDFPESVAANFAKQLSTDLGTWVKSTVRLGDLKVSKLPGTNQLISEDIVEKAQPILQSFPEASQSTYYLILTSQDINSASAGFRFQFSTHNKELKTSVVSLARMVDYLNGQPAITDASISRLYKMSKRAIGELHLSWKRSTNPKDIMYSPIMGVADIDRIGTEHLEENVENQDSKNAIKPTL